MVSMNLAQSPLHFARRDSSGRSAVHSVRAARSCRARLSLDARLPRHASSAVQTAHRSQGARAVTPAASPARLFVPSAFPFAFVLPFPFGAAFCTPRQTRKAQLGQSRKHQQIGRAKHLQQPWAWQPPCPFLSPCPSPSLSPSPCSSPPAPTKHSVNKLC